MVRFLIQVAAKKVSHTIFHDAFFDFREIIDVHSEIFDQSSSFLDVVIGAQSLDQLQFEAVVVCNQKLGRLGFVHVNQSEHDSSQIEVLLELVSHDHQSSVVKPVFCKLLFGYIHEDFGSDQVSDFKLGDKVRHQI